MKKTAEILDCITEGAFILSKDMKFLFVTPKAKKLLNIGEAAKMPEELISEFSLKEIKKEHAPTQMKKKLKNKELIFTFYTLNTKEFPDALYLVILNRESFNLNVSLVLNEVNNLLSTVVGSITLASMRLKKEDSVLGYLKKALEAITKVSILIEKLAKANHTPKVLPNQEASIQRQEILKEKENFNSYSEKAPEIIEAELIEETETLSEKRYSHRILLVDDEEMVRKVGEELLTHMGYQVTTAKSAQEAISVYKNSWSEIDLVILDLIMDDLDGEVVLTEILSVNPKAKVILSSGLPFDERVKKAIKRGACAFVRKPYTLENLANTVKAVLIGLG